MKARCLLLALLVMTNCGVFKKTHNDSSKSLDTKIETTESRKVVTEQYGDVISGTVPLPKLTKDPVHVPIESTGIRLDLYIKDGNVGYRAEARPTAKTSTEDAKEHTDVSHKTETGRKSRDAERRTLLPWWLWIVAALAMAAILLYKFTGLSTYVGPVEKVIKNLLKPRKNGQ